MRIKTKNLIGEGAAIAIRCDDDTLGPGEPEQFYTTENKINITGTKDWESYSIEMDEAVETNITSIRIFMMFLPNTSGTVYFDYVSLEEIS